MDHQGSSAQESILVLTRHPLAFQAVEKALASSCYVVKPYSENLREAGDWVLIIDAFSIEEWPKMATECQLRGGRCIVLVPGSVNRRQMENRLIYLGIQGVVPMANLDVELMEAVQSVTSGHLWINRASLETYIQRTNMLGGRSVNNHRFTLREEQIIPFLMTGFSNKDIANTLRISSRTVKFHVSNILRKFNVESRKVLREISVDSVSRENTRIPEPVG